MVGSSNVKLLVFFCMSLCTFLSGAMTAPSCLNVVCSSMKEITELRTLHGMSVFVF